MWACDDLFKAKKSCNAHIINCKYAVEKEKKIEKVFNY